MRNITQSSNQKAKELFISNYPLLASEKAELRLFAEAEVPYKAK